MFLSLQFALAAAALILTASAAHAQLVNPSFEEPRNSPGTPNYDLLHEDSVPGWETDATNHEIEIWSDSYSYGGFPPAPTASFDLDQHAELNASLVSTLYQDVPAILPVGTPLGFEFAHRGRLGTDTMRLTITDLGPGGTFGGGDDTVLFTKEYSTANAAWALYTSAGELPILSLGNPMRFAYESVDAAGGSETFGNFIDLADFGDHLAPEVTVTKEIVNDTGQPVNDVEWTVYGDYTSTLVAHSDGPFQNFAVTLVGGNTRFTWSNPAANIAPGGSVTLGVTVYEPYPITKRVTWTFNGQFIDCVEQVSDVDNVVEADDFTSLFGNTISDFGEIDPCEYDRWVGDAFVEWLATEAPIEDLTDGVDRSPLRTDVISGTYQVPPDTEVPLTTPPPPAGARFAVIRFAVADGPGLTDASIDYVQVGVPAPSAAGPAVPVASRLGVVALVVLLLLLGSTIRRRVVSRA
jgi:hypothetical protein